MRRILVAILWSASACSGADSGTNPDPDIDPVEVSLAPDALEIEVGEIRTLLITVSGGVQQASASWICVSSDPQTASTDATAEGCRVTGREPGVATATAAVTKGNTTTVATATVTVRTPPPPPPLEAALDPSETIIDLGHTVELEVQVSGGISGTPVSWTCVSNNLLVASVISTASGCEVTGDSPGGATITATVSKGSETIDAGAGVTVLPSPFPPVQVFFQPGGASMRQAETLELGLLVLGGDPAAQTTWTCTAADPEVVAAAVTVAGCRVTGLDPGSTVLTAVVTRGVEVAPADANILISAAQGRSEADPAPVGTAVTVIVDDPQVPWTTLRLTLLETLSGTAALQAALAWSPQNNSPLAGFEYRLGRFRIKVLSQDDPTEAYQESELNFESVSGTGVVYGRASVCCNSPSVGQEGFAGAVWEGWADMLSGTTDTNPLAVYRRGESSEAWFDL